MEDLPASQIIYWYSIRSVFLWIKEVRPLPFHACLEVSISYEFFFFLIEKLENFSVFKMSPDEAKKDMLH